jgi:hypothetical protein
MLSATFFGYSVSIQMMPFARRTNEHHPSLG